MTLDLEAWTCPRGHVYAAINPRHQPAVILRVHAIQIEGDTMICKCLRCSTVIRIEQVEARCRALIEQFLRNR